MSVFAAEVPGARSLALGSRGTVFVGSMRAGNVYAIVDADRDGRADRVIRIADHLKVPNGVAFRDGALYVAELGRILRFDGIEERLENPPAPVVVYDGFPEKRQHGWKFLAFGPDGLLYVPQGMPCNICKENDPFGTITRMKPDGSGLQVVARGIRNTVGFDWQPGTKELWFTDNGRDWMGDDLPPDELNRVSRAGEHFGFPFCHGADVKDPEFGAEHACKEFTPPAIALGPHVAALGMRFYTGTSFPAAYRGAIFIAEHGSWNRSHKIGYRVSVVKLEGSKAVSYRPFAEGWLKGETVRGRPVDVLVMPDGALLVSDDDQGVVYRITAR